MGLRLPSDTPMFQSDAWQTWSTLDLVFTSPELSDWLVVCDAKLENRLPGADHLSIHTVFNIATVTSNIKPRRNFKDVSWSDFIKSMQLSWSNQDHTSILNHEDIDSAVKNLTKTLQHAIEKHVPWSKKSPYVKRWWSKELSELRAEYARSSRLEFQARNTPNWEPALKVKREAHNRYNCTLWKTKNDHW